MAILTPGSPLSRRAFPGKSAARSGGDAKNGDVNSDGFAEGFGQVWEYEAKRHGDGRLRLVFASSGGDELDSPDNLVVTPRGGL